MKVNKYTRIYRLILWFISFPLPWIFAGMVIATASNMYVVVNALHEIDKLLVCK